MKIADIVLDILIEEIKDKKLLNLINVWFGGTPTNEQQAEGEYLIEKYVELKNTKRLGIQLPQIKTFKRKFKDFQDQDLTNAVKFSYKQMRFLISEYFNVPNFGGGIDNSAIESKVPEILRGHDLKPSANLVNASKELWYGQNEYLIIDEGDFRVYKIPDRKASIYFGYYEEFVTRSDFFEKQPEAHMQWCTTRWRRDSNLYTNYRDRNYPRTFYFVIDETKNPEVETNIKVAQYYLSALQTSGDASSGFRLTSILNNGSDPEFSLEKLYQTYPKLQGHIDKIVPVKYNRKVEIEDSTNEVDYVNEREGDEYEFAGVSGALKRQYIHNGKLITKPLSWEYMDDELRKAYINMTEKEENTPQERFGSKILFDYIRTIPQDLKSLDNRLKVIGLGGVSFLVKYFIDNTCNVAYFGKKDANVIVYQNRDTHKYGIFNKKYPDWLLHDGVHYTDTFVHTDTQDIPFEMPNGDVDAYFISEYTNDNNQKFYTIEKDLPEKDEAVSAYVLSGKQFLNVIDKIKETNEIKPEDADLGEMKKGV